MDSVLPHILLAPLPNSHRPCPLHERLRGRLSTLHLTMHDCNNDLVGLCAPIQASETQLFRDRFRVRHHARIGHDALRFRSEYYI